MIDINNLAKNVAVIKQIFIKFNEYEIEFINWINMRKMLNF